MGFEILAGLIISAVVAVISSTIGTIQGMEEADYNKALAESQKQQAQMNAEAVRREQKVQLDANDQEAEHQARKQREADEADKASARARMGTGGMVAGSGSSLMNQVEDAKAMAYNYNEILRQGKIQHNAIKYKGDIEIYKYGLQEAEASMKEKHFRKQKGEILQDYAWGFLLTHWITQPEYTGGLQSAVSGMSSMGMGSMKGAEGMKGTGGITGSNSNISNSLEGSLNRNTGAGWDSYRNSGSFNATGGYNSTKNFGSLLS